MRLTSFLSVLLLLMFPLQLPAQVGEGNLEIISREDWGAQAPVMEMIRHIPNLITIHHTATRQNPERPTAEKLQALQKFSFREGSLGNGQPKKAWADVPYHFYIAANGEIAEARELQYQGDSNTDYNLTGHALIVLEGNFEIEQVTPAQEQSLEKLVAFLATKYKIPADKISGHKDQADTACPGSDLYELLPQLRETIGQAEASRVIIGAEQLFSEEFLPLVKGKRIGLVTNHTGVLPDGTHLIDLLHENPEVDLSLLFGPEHGLRGEKDAHVADGVDPETGISIISLYGKVRKPTNEMLKQVDVLVFDIQDIGARFYTYIKTMLRVQEAAAEEGIPFIVLDRPNPIGGTYVDGPVGKALEPVTGIGNIPVTHGMTIGELALMYNGERTAQGLSEAELTVIPMKNYSRTQWYDETGLPWIKPSPNMLTLETAAVYPATCLLEGTNISEARGTMFPFEHFGAPWVESEELARQLNSYKLEGVVFRPKTFSPDSLVDGIMIHPPKFLGEKVPGVEMHITDRNAFRSAEAGVYILHALLNLYPEKFEWREGRIDGLLGTSAVREQLQAGVHPDEIVGKWKKDISEFTEKRKKYLIY